MGGDKDPRRILPFLKRPPLLLAGALPSSFSRLPEGRRTALGRFLIAHEVRHLGKEGLQFDAHLRCHLTFSHGLPHDLKPAVPLRHPDPEGPVTHAEAGVTPLVRVAGVPAQPEAQKEIEMAVMCYLCSSFAY